MLTYEIQYQSQYSRGELLLRTFFGWLYLALPHMLVMFVFSIALWFMTIAAFFIILFTGETPQWYFEWTIKLQRWGLRVGARMFNLVDGYPAFGLDGTDDKTNLELSFWQIGRGELLLRVLLGAFYVGIPHMFVLFFRNFATCFLVFLAFFVVLFTGKYPEDWHRFNTGTMRWTMRVTLFFAWLYRDYPPFSGRPDQNLLNELNHLGNK